MRMARLGSLLRRHGRLALVRLQELIQFLLRFFAVVAVALLELADQLLGFALDLSQIVVGELAPAGLDVALHLSPFALENVAVHVASLEFERTGSARAVVNCCSRDSS